jgi:hypothetical protein
MHTFAGKSWNLDKKKPESGTNNPIQQAVKIAVLSPVLQLKIKTP